MKDERTEKLAKLLVDYSVAVNKGDRVSITAESGAVPLLEAVYRRVVLAGGYPIVLLEPEGLSEWFLKNATDEQLEYIHEPDRIITEKYDVNIHLGGSANTKAMSNLDPTRLVRRERARTSLMQTSMRRSASGELRWVYAIYPANAYAQDADMSLSEYEDFVFGACLPDINDPVGFWRAFSARQEKIIDWLKGKSQVHITGPETDLTLSVAGRRFANADGRYNMPDGEVFTGPAEDSIDGHVFFSFPAIEGGREVTGVRLWFEKGMVVRATAEKNEEFLLKTLDTDAGARRVGEFAIGTSPGINRFTRQILFDEKINGTIHMALGAGYPETGSLNESAIHWDMICDLRDGGEIAVDGQLLHKNGQFVIDF